MLMKMHDAAAETIETSLRAAPHNPRLLHHLGLVTATKIFASRERAVDRWKRLVHAWGAVFADERF
jgi:hypothetical protein